MKKLFISILLMALPGASPAQKMQTWTTEVFTMQLPADFKPPRPKRERNYYLDGPTHGYHFYKKARIKITDIPFRQHTASIIWEAQVHTRKDDKKPMDLYRYWKLDTAGREYQHLVYEPDKPIPSMKYDVIIPVQFPDKVIPIYERTWAFRTNRYMLFLSLGSFNQELFEQHIKQAENYIHTLQLK